MNPILVLFLMVAFAFLVVALMLFVAKRRRLAFAPVRLNVVATGGLVTILLGNKSAPVQQVWAKRDPQDKRPSIRSGRGSPTHRPKALLCNATPTQRANYRRHQSYR